MFSKKFFTGWVVIGIMWMFFSAGCVGLYPLWEGRKTSVHTFKAIFRDLSGKGRPKATLHEGEGTDTPPEVVGEKTKE